MRGTLKSEKTAAKRQRVYTGLGITGVCLLFAAAMLFPKYYHQVQDNLTMQQVNDMDLSFDMYETPYDSFYDKLETLARCVQEKITLQSMKVAEINNVVTDEELTEIVNDECEELRNENVLGEAYQFDAESLTEREMDTIYTTEEGEELQGIHYWKLTYEVEECQVEVYLDTDFHKIYELRMTQNASQVTDSFKGQKRTEEYMETGYAWAEGITLYYGVEKEDWMFGVDEQKYLGNGNDSYDMSPYNFGIVVFMENGSLQLCQSGTVENGTECWSIGILLENMIQK